MGQFRIEDFVDILRDHREGILRYPTQEGAATQNKTLPNAQDILSTAVRRAAEANRLAESGDSRAALHVLTIFSLLRNHNLMQEMFKLAVEDDRRNKTETPAVQ
jgi:hypothetical protein